MPSNPHSTTTRDTGYARFNTTHRRLLRRALAMTPLICLAVISGCSTTPTKPHSATGPSKPSQPVYPTYWIADGSTDPLPSVASLTWTDHDGQLTGNYQDIHAPISGEASTLAGTLTGTLAGHTITLDDSAPSSDPSLGTAFQTGTITPTLLKIHFVINNVTHTTTYLPGSAAQFNQIAARVLGTS